MTRKRVELHIEELELPGHLAGSAGRVGASLTRHLAMLLEDGGLPGAFEQSTSMTEADGGNAVLNPGTGSRDAGRRLAQAVYRGLAGAGSAGAAEPGGGKEQR